MTTRDVRPAHLAPGRRRIVIGEFVLIIAVLAVVDTSATRRLGWFALTVVSAVLACARWRHQNAGAWFAIAIRFAVRRRAWPGPIDPDPTVVAAVELGDPDTHVTTSAIAVPVGLLRSNDPAAPAVQPIVVTSSGYQRVFLITRAAAGELTGAVRWIGRHLAASGVPYRRIDPDAVLRAALGTGPVQESWSHLATNAGVQATLRVRLGTAGLTQDHLVPLTGMARVTTVLTWSDVDAMVRVVAPSTAELDSAVASIRSGVAAIRTSLTTGPVERLDGEHLAAWWLTQPLGTARSSRRLSRSGSGSLTFGPVGLLVGYDRYGQEVRIRVPPDRDRPVRVVVAGTGTAARLLTARVRESGVPVVVSTVHQPAAPDPIASTSTALTSADVVICHAMPAEDAAVVSAMLGLTHTGEWLSRTRGDMVAVIGDGSVRWAQLPSGSVTSQRITGLVGIART